MNDLISKMEILKLVAHPARIAILEELLNGVKCVSDLQEFLEIRSEEHTSELQSH